MAKLITLVGDEIIRANEVGRKRTTGLMVFVECEVELGFDVEWKAGGGFDLFGIELGIDGKQKIAHKIKVNIMPRQAKASWES